MWEIFCSSKCKILEDVICKELVVRGVKYKILKSSGVNVKGL